MNCKIDACPLCGHTQFKEYLNVRDHVVSKEYFNLVECTSCAFVYTNPRPKEADLAKYYDSQDYISHSNTNHNVLDVVYFLARRFMLQKKASWVYSVTKIKGRILDYGCGTGAFLNHLKNEGWEALGVEPNANARAIANNKNQQAYPDIESLPTGGYDAITLWHVLEHIPDIHDKMIHLIGLLKKSGVLFLAVPNCASYDAVYYRENWAGYDVPRHVSHFTPETMKLLAKKHRLHIIKTIPLKLDAYYISILSEKYLKGSMFNALVQALKSNRQAKKNHQNYSSLVYVLKK
jgi:2-polyprenyl-3-methyl-5-hydroxy-6-metoxy-1,4-benzoquinol methylase